MGKTVSETSMGILSKGTGERQSHGRAPGGQQRLRGGLYGSPGRAVPYHSQDFCTLQRRVISHQDPGFGPQGTMTAEYSETFPMCLQAMKASLILARSS